MINLEALTAEVTRAQTVTSSAVTLLKRLTSELELIEAKLAVENADVAPLNDLIGKLKESTDSLAGAVADSLDKHPVHEVILNAEDTSTPTVQVVMPEVLPENVVVTTEQLVDVIDPASAEPQIAVYVEAAPAVDPAAPVAPAVETVIETPEGQTDVTVSIPTEVQDAAPAGIDLAEVVKEAVAEAEVPAEPVAEAPADAPPADPAVTP